MAHPQSSPRGHIAFKRIDVGGAQLTADANGLLKLNAGLLLSGKTTNGLTQNSTGFVFASQVQIGGSRYINANSTAFIFTSEASLPSTDNGVALTLVSNSTGVAVAVNSTGTTWKYLSTTSVQPT